MIARDTALIAQLRRVASLADALVDPEAGEIAVNRPGEMWIERGGRWEPQDAPEIDGTWFERFPKTVASFNDDDTSASRPILSAVLSGGERIQIVQPPACESDTASITIRKPAPAGSLPPLDSWAAGPSQARKALEVMPRLDPRQYIDALRHAVASGLTIALGGSTGSGKTTLLRRLAHDIPESERIVTVEDTRELFIDHLPNRVHLLYRADARDAAEGQAIDASTLIRSSLRMKPDRVLFGELRGGEAWDWLQVALTGHAGSVTTVHASSCAAVLERLVILAQQSPRGRALAETSLRRMVRMTVDVVAHVERDPEGGPFRITDVWRRREIDAWGLDA